MGAWAWPAGGELGLARLRVSIVRVRVSRIRAWPELERPTCQMPIEWHWSSGGLRLSRRKRVRVS